MLLIALNIRPGIQDISYDINSLHRFDPRDLMHGILHNAPYPENESLTDRMSLENYSDEKAFLYLELAGVVGNRIDRHVGRDFC
jgi:hypothetical protein